MNPYQLENSDNSFDNALPPSNGISYRTSKGTPDEYSAMNHIRLFSDKSHQENMGITAYQQERRNSGIVNNNVSSGYLSSNVGGGSQTMITKENVNDVSTISDIV